MSSHRRSTHVPAVRLETEKSLGITQRRAPLNFAWTGDIRKR
jgi:tRNA pseudouridine13 synthase